MFKWIFESTPEGRNKVWTLLFVILIPLVLLVGIIGVWLSGNLQNYQVLLSIVGLFLFIILWSTQVIKGTYLQPLQSTKAEILYRFSGWTLIFIFVLITDNLILGGLAGLNPGLSQNILVCSTVYFLFSSVGWELGRLFRLLGPKTTKKQETTPHSILEQAVLGLLGYLLIAWLFFVTFAHYETP